MFISKRKLLNIRHKFNKIGYVRLRLFNKNQTNHFKKNLSKLVLAKIKKINFKKYLFFSNKKNEQVINGGLLFLEKNNHQNIVSIYNIINKSNFFLSISNNEKLIRIISFILNKSNYHPFYFNSDALRMDMPRDKKFLYGWHRDSRFNLYNSEFIQLWTPMVNDITKFNKIGGLQIIDRSHLLKIDTIDKKSAEGRKKNKLIRTPYNEIIYQDRKKVKKLAFNEIYANVGEAVLFSNKLLHRSSVNHSKNKVRLVLNTFYHDMTNEKAIFENIDQRTSDWKNFFKQ